MTHPAVHPETPRVAVAAGCTLGEGVLWDHRNGHLIWVDIKGQAVWRWNPTTEKTDRVEVGEPVGFVALTPDPDIVIAGFKSGLARLHLWGGQIQPLVQPEPGRPGNRINDGHVGPDGTLYFGTMNDGGDEPTGSFWRYDGEELNAFRGNIVTTNGPAVSADGRTLYAADSRGQTVHAHDLHGGVPGEARLFARFEEGWGHPDGMAADEEGHVWICHWGGSRISRFAPDGSVERTLPVPTALVTKCAFGGPDLTTLYITTARMDRDPHLDPMAGHVFAVEAGVKGLPANVFTGEDGMSVERFGRLEDTDVLEVTLRNAAGAEARVLTWGAVLRRLVVPVGGATQSVVLGLDRIEDYVASSPYFGAVPGRYANRIGGARFRLGGEEYRLDANEGRNQLHGGPRGFGKRLWTLLDHGPAHAVLTLLSPDGDMGYPGRLVATCAYTLLEPATLRIALEATCDRPTPVNLTTHSYYNLDGSPDICAHHLQIAADFITPTDAEKIPTGEIRTVNDTLYDFTTLRPIGAAQLLRCRTSYDINYVLRGADEALAHAATVASRGNGLSLELWTTEPGLQFYDGHMLKLPVPGLGGVAYGPRAGLCLEPQRFPDGPNKRHFPPCILEPGEVSRQVSEVRFAPL